MNKPKTEFVGWYVPVSALDANGDLQRNVALGEQYDDAFEVPNASGGLNEMECEPIYEWKEQRGFVAYTHAFDAALANRRPHLTGIHRIKLSGTVVESKQWPGTFVATHREILDTLCTSTYWRQNLSEIVGLATQMLLSNRDLWGAPPELQRGLDSQDEFHVGDKGFVFSLCRREKVFKALHRLSLYYRDPRAFVQHLETDPTIRMAYELARANPDHHALKTLKRFFERQYV